MRGSRLPNRREIFSDGFPHNSCDTGDASPNLPHSLPPETARRQLSKTTPSLEQIRAILQACEYRGKGEDAGTDRELLEKCTLAELQVR